jgi:glycerate 2-kinase
LVKSPKLEIREVADQHANAVSSPSSEFKGGRKTETMASESPFDQNPRAALLRRHALQIWRAGVDAVLPRRLIPRFLRVEAHSLRIGNDTIPLDTIRRIVVVGAGKAGAGMAQAVEAALGPELAAAKQLTGWVNVPSDVGATAGLSSSALRLTTRATDSADTAGPASSGTQSCPLGRQECLPYCVERIHLHPARPAGVNEPTPEGVAGSLEILRLVESLGPDDLCLCLISGGGSALMPAPVEGITLADKLAITRHLSAAGANIEQLNTVRKQLSRIKGGGLLRACRGDCPGFRVNENGTVPFHRAARLISLIISDVLGDPLDIIASGPTVPDTSTPQAALAVLEQFGVREAGIAPAAIAYLQRTANSRGPTARGEVAEETARVLGHADRGPLAPRYSSTCPISGGTLQPRVANIILASNATAVAAAAAEAERLGYSVASMRATCSEGPAEEVGRELAEKALTIRSAAAQVGAAVTTRSAAAQVGAAVELPPQPDAPTCFISGGEPVVRLVESSRRGLGGRNQQLVLAALLRLWDEGAKGIALLSGGTDGEDGPTDAAGALLDADVLAAAREMNLDPAEFLARNDAYHFFEPLGALIKTGPTQTNVCDVRVVVCDAKPQAAG